MLSLLERRTLAPPAYLKLAPAGDPPAAPARSDAPVSVVIATQRRPEGLARAARSVLLQAGVDPRRLELVIVDNDAVPSAAPLAEALAGEAPFPVLYVHEPEPGVANARNAALRAAGAELIAFLDDDEEAAPGWLAALLEAQALYGADVVFGPVRARAPDWVREHRAYLEAFFSREGPAEAGVIAHYYGCGDSLLRRGALPDPGQPFSTDRNETGGEDDHLFGAMHKAGARFAWAPAALVYEHPAPQRLTLRYALARAFAYGQGPTYGCATSNPPDWGGVARWMAVGCAQAAVFGPLALAQCLARRPHRAYVLDRFVRGAGKVLFGGPFAMRFYGRAGGGDAASRPVRS